MLSTAPQSRYKKKRSLEEELAVLLISFNRHSACKVNSDRSLERDAEEFADERKDLGCLLYIGGSGLPYSTQLSTTIQAFPHLHAPA